MFQKMITPTNGSGESDSPCTIGGVFTSSTTQSTPVNLGFKPKYLFVMKKTGSYGTGCIYDEATSSTSYKRFYIPNGSWTGYDNWAASNTISLPATPDTYGGLVSIDDNGFTWSSVPTVSPYNYGGDYIYWAIG